MDFFSQVVISIQENWLVLPAFLFVLSVVVFFHELGHFQVARWCGIGVEAFSIGFGPEIYGFRDKRGTRWRIAWIPLGGYVKFYGDDNVASVPDQDTIKSMSAEERALSFHTKPLWARAAVVAAGPLANFILAIVIFAGILTFYGERITIPRVDAIEPGSAAEKAGFEVGDVIKSIDGASVRSFKEVVRLVKFNAGQPLKFGMDRGGSLIELTATPTRKKEENLIGRVSDVGFLGIASRTEQWVDQSYDPFTAVWMGTKETGMVITTTMTFIYRIFTGQESADKISGPVGIAQMSGKFAELGIIPLMSLVAYLSVSIGLLNLFPIPILDGGHLLFYAIEAIRGRPLSERNQEFGFRIGLVLVVMLMLFALRNDLIPNREQADPPPKSLLELQSKEQNKRP